MVATSFCNGGDTLGLTSYDGLVDGRRTYHLDSQTPKSDSSWNFFREGDNHFYIKGEAFSNNGNCKNNLVISNHRGINLEKVRNAFIIANSSEVAIMPISKVEEVLELSMNLLPKGKIQYHLPQSVCERENTPNLTSEEVKTQLRESYHLDVKMISPITSGRSKEGVYYVVGRDGKKFIFKFRGNCKENVRSLSGILRDIPEYFPRIHPRKDDPASLILEVNKGFYWLEDFIGGGPLERTCTEYSSLMGTLIAGLHKSFETVLQGKDNSRGVFCSRGDYFGESTLLSTYLDLVKSRVNQDFLLPHLRPVIGSGLSRYIKVLPKSLVHGDLNNSNVFTGDGFPKIIDSESFRISPRIIEFVAPLILEGNQNPPRYVPGSLPRIIKNYNDASDRPISREEKNFLSDILISSILRYHVVRKIRRNLPKESSKQIEESLNLLEEDKRE